MNVISFFRRRDHPLADIDTEETHGPAQPSSSSSLSNSSAQHRVLTDQPLRFPFATDLAAPSLCIAVAVIFGVGAASGYYAWQPLHRWRVRRWQNLARRRADPLRLLPLQACRGLRGQLGLLMGWPRATRRWCLPSLLLSGPTVGTDHRATAQWGQRLLRRVYRGTLHAPLLQWHVLPLLPCAPLHVTFARDKSEASTGGSGAGRDTCDTARSGLWLLQKQSFNVLYNPTTRAPVWCGYYLTPDSLTRARQQPRLTNFFADHTVPKASRASLAEMKHPHFDRGHLAPHASVACTPQAAVEASLLTNVVLQHKGVNRGVWKQLERLTREYVLDVPSTARRAQLSPPPAAASIKPRRAPKTAVRRKRTARTASAAHRIGRARAPKARARASGKVGPAPVAKRGRGRPRRQPVSPAAPACALGAATAQTTTLTALMEAHTPYSLTVATRVRRARQHARLRRLPRLVGRPLAALSLWGEHWWQARARARRQRHHASRQRPRLAVCVGPLLLGEVSQTGRRRGRPPLGRASTSGSATDPTRSEKRIPDALFMAVWDPDTHNHAAFVVPNTEAGDVHPSDRPPRSARRSPRNGVREGDWTPVLARFIVEWGELEHLLTRSIAAQLNESPDVVASWQLFPHLQLRRRWRTVGPRGKAALQRGVVSVAARVRACGAALRRTFTAARVKPSSPQPGPVTPAASPGTSTVSQTPPLATNSVQVPDTPTM